MSKPILVEEVFGVNKEIVWNAITRLDQMNEWFFDNIPAFEPIEGFDVKFNVNSGERDFMHVWNILEVVENKKIVYSWKYENYEGKGTVIFELFEREGYTKLRVTNLGLETFPQDVPEFRFESCLNGWEYFINGRLKEYIDKFN